MYDGFGSLLGDYDVNTGLPETYTDPVGFGGQYGYYTDPETGLALMTHRYYDAGRGRFLTRDPIGYSGGLNLYGFVGNNPITGADPDGTNPVTDTGQELLGYWASLGSQVFSGVTDPINGAKVGIAEYKLARKVGYGRAVRITLGAQLSGIGHAYTDAFNPHASAYAHGASMATIDLTAVSILLGGVAFGKAPAGDLTPAERSTIQGLTNKAQRPIYVIGSAAKGTRRGVSTNLPIGKGPGTRSDID